MKKIKVNDKCTCGSNLKYKKCCMLNFKTILSTSAIKENENKKEYTEFDIVKEYINLPNLPINLEIIIDKIEIYNYSPNERNSNNFIKYSTFTQLNETDYPLGNDSKIDYMSDEYISPVVIIDIDGTKYKTHYYLWFPLRDIHDGILIKQSITSEKIFPKKIFIDSISYKCKWIVDLFNLIGTNILDKL